VKLYPAFAKLKGEDLNFRRALATAQKAAGTDLPVLILGESGTGKELLARAIHQASDRREYQFVDINCAALPDELIESELFGYEGGSFTGAITKGRHGLFQNAHRGTFFMDEIGDTSLRTQAKILRVLEQGSFKRVGGRQNIQVDVRIVSATNKDLTDLILEGCFREDLLYRLNTIPITLPPLRERGDDILLLLDYFLKKYMKRKNPRVKFSHNSLEILGSYSWPGNVRELRSVVDYAVTMAPSTFITPDYLPSFLFPAKAHDMKENRSLSSIIPNQKTFNLPTVVKDVERNLIKNVLLESENRSKAIRLLGISRRTFYKKIKEYGLD